MPAQRTQAASAAQSEVTTAPRPDGTLAPVRPLTETTDLADMTGFGTGRDGAATRPSWEISAGTRTDRTTTMCPWRRGRVISRCARHVDATRRGVLAALSITQTWVRQRVTAPSAAGPGNRRGQAGRAIAWRDRQDPAVLAQGGDPAAKRSPRAERLGPVAASGRPVAQPPPHQTPKSPQCAPMAAAIRWHPDRVAAWLPPAPRSHCPHPVAASGPCSFEGLVFPPNLTRVARNSRRGNHA